MDMRTAFPVELAGPRWIELGWSEAGLRWLRFREEQPEAPSDPIPTSVGEAMGRIQDFLQGRGYALEGCPVDLCGLPPFQRRALEALRSTRPGQTLSYGTLALLAGSPGAARAAGQAMARNPLPLVVPCHRVVGAKGPGGFSLFGTLETKALLMSLEAPLEN